MRKLQDSLPLEQYMQIRDLTYDATHTFNSAHPSTNRALTPIEKRLSRVGEILPSGQQVQRMNYIDIQAGLTLDGAGLSTIQSLLESTQGRVKTLILRINYATCYPEMPNGIVLNAGASILRGDDFDETYTVTMKDTYHITITGATVNVIEAMKEMLRAVHGQNYEEKLVIHTEDMREIAQRDSRPVPLQTLLRLRTPTLTLNHFDMSPITVDRSIPIDTVMTLIPSVQDNNAQGRSRRSRAFRRRNRGLRW
ncbi:hypothetical protein PMZ80_000161 [Knufia obscura]|uniref:Uncharacterized protein n=1 Tax=Knufia obscura TaxID=1635080 RepID=A0ABR0RZH8_9EURO|nr:hypothetical protein PMZ80_000161 [Knufia obscura]